MTEGGTPHPRPSLGEFTRVRKDSWLDHQVLQGRRQMHKAFLTAFSPVPSDHILDLGTSPLPELHATNPLLQFSPELKVHACGIDPISTSWHKIHPNTPYTQADACELPFDSASFDLVHCNAVIEHVGGRERQKMLIAECFRVARRGVFITTPNRWFPVDFHTMLPLIHWLPKPWHRQILSTVGLTGYASEQTLNLLGDSDMHALVWGVIAKMVESDQRLCCRLVDFRITANRFYGLSANIMFAAHLSGLKTPPC